MTARKTTSSRRAVFGDLYSEFEDRDRPSDRDPGKQRQARHTDQAPFYQKSKRVIMQLIICLGGIYNSEIFRSDTPEERVMLQQRIYSALPKVKSSSR